MKKKLSYRIQSEDLSRVKTHRLDHLLFDLVQNDPTLGKNFPPTRSKVRSWIMRGSVFVDRRRMRVASRTLRVGQWIELHADLNNEKNRAGPIVRSTGLLPEQILYEDDVLIAIDKPSGLPTQPTLDRSRDHAFGWVKKHLGPKGYVGLHHRLDSQTSGVLLLTKDKRANKSIADSFKFHTITKEYWALVQVRDESAVRLLQKKSFDVRNYLKPTKPSGKKTRVIAVKSGGDLAQTFFEVLEFGANWALIKALPKTGRMHQIRVHLSGLGLPIWGDPHYGGDFLPKESGVQNRVLLHAKRLSLRHPLAEKGDPELSVESPLPEDFQRVIDFFKQGLARN